MPTGVEYFIKRLLRRLLPEGIAAALLARNILLKAGLETTDPEAAVRRYIADLSAQSLSIQGKHILLFGYGGCFGVALGLLKQGAAHVYLCDKDARPDDRRNRKLIRPELASWVFLKEKKVMLNPECITLVPGEAEAWAEARGIYFDLVLSTSVLEHVDDAETVIGVLGAITHPQGGHLHFIDLRDHFFKYPFHMLCYSRHVWHRLLNPGCNLNRLRVKDYKRIFNLHFNDVRVKTVSSDLPSYRKIEKMVRPEFKTGDPAIDAATIISVSAQLPIVSRGRR